MTDHIIPGMRDVLGALAGHRFSLEDEKRTQNEIWSVLCSDPRTWNCSREVRIAGGIIDFVVDAGNCIGIEVKLKGQPAAIVRQVKGYAAEPRLDGLVLVTAKPVALGPKIFGTPVVAFDLARAWL